MVHHEIIPIELKTIFTVVYHVLHAFGRSIHLILDLFLNHFFENVFLIGKLILKPLLDKRSKIIAWPNIIKVNLPVVLGIRSWVFLFIILDLLLLQILLDNTIIGEMWKSRFGIGVVILSSHSDVTLVINPNSQRVPVCHKNPLSYIKLFLVYNQWIFYVFLHHLPAFCCFYELYNILVLCEYFNTSSTAFLARLNNPDVICPIQWVLRKFVFQFYQDLSCVLNHFFIVFLIYINLFFPKYICWLILNLNNVFLILFVILIFWSLKEMIVLDFKNLIPFFLSQTFKIFIIHCLTLSV